MLEFDFFIYYNFLSPLLLQCSFSACLQIFIIFFLIGCKQNGTKLGDVILPPWAKGDPREFIRVHREVICILIMTKENISSVFVLHINLSSVHAVTTTSQSMSSGLMANCCKDL